jgi:Tfp pilus assembly protein PilV
MPAVNDYRGPRRRTGASLVEILIACVMLTIVIMGLLGSSKKVSESMFASRQQLIAASVAQARLDSLSSLGCASIASGTGTTRGIAESWTVTSTTTTRVVSLTLTIPKMSRTLNYKTVIPCV